MDNLELNPVIEQKPQDDPILVAINAEIQKLNDPNIPFNEKLDKIVELKTKLAPAVFKELFAKNPNSDVSLIASRACSILKETATIIIKKREFEISDDINPHSPKFQKAFAWFLELIHTALQDNNMDEIQINNVFSTVSGRLIGWEDLLLKQLKGLSSKALETVDNPFLKKVQEVSNGGQLLDVKDTGSDDQKTS